MIGLSLIHISTGLEALFGYLYLSGKNERITELFELVDVYKRQGMDCELLDWLNLHAFPEEAKYADIDYAKKAYKLFVEDIKTGYTTRASIFGTLHKESTLYLMSLLENSGLKTMVGKVNMDRNSPDYLWEESAEKLSLIHI